MKRVACCLVACLAGIAFEPVSADPFIAGNILLSTDGTVYEYTPAGVQVQEITVPELDSPYFPYSSAGKARDIIVHPSGELLVFNGKFPASMSTYDPGADSWTHQSFTDWDMVANVAYGGIATDGRFVYVCDSTLGSSSNPGGVVRFDRQDGSAIRSSVSRDAHDLALGLDGFLYTLSGENTVNKFDPANLDHLGDIYSGSGLRGLAVDVDGSMFVVAGGWRLRHYAADGSFLGELELPTAGTVFTSEHQDVDLLPDGSILVGQRWGSVVQTDRDFSSATAFQGPTERPTFVAFTNAVPEPSTAILAGIAAIALAVLGVRRRRTPT